MQVAELRDVISKDLRFPRDRLKLVRKGKALDENDGSAKLQDGGVLHSFSLLPTALYFWMPQLEDSHLLFSRPFLSSAGAADTSQARSGKWRCIQFL